MGVSTKNIPNIWLIQPKTLNSNKSKLIVREPFNIFVPSNAHLDNSKNYVVVKADSKASNLYLKWSLGHWVWISNLVQTFGDGLSSNLDYHIPYTNLSWLDTYNTNLK